MGRQKMVEFFCEDCGAITIHYNLKPGEPAFCYLCQPKYRRNSLGGLEKARNSFPSADRGHPRKPPKQMAQKRKEGG